MSNATKSSEPDPTAEALKRADRQATAIANARPTKQDQRTARRLLDRIEQIAAVLTKGFDPDEVVITRHVSPLEADGAAEKLELIEAECRKLRLALRAAASVQAAVQGQLV